MKIFDYTSKEFKNLDKLKDTINENAIINSNLDYLNVNLPSGLTICFCEDLENPEITELNNVVNTFDDPPISEITTMTQIKTFYPQFQFGSEMDWSQYLVSWTDGITQNNKLQRSNCNNGLRWGNTSPILIPFSGNISKATCTVKGMSVSTGNPSSICELKFELWKVGWTNEGTILGNIIFNVDTFIYPVGQWWNAYQYNTNFIGQTDLDIDVNIGDMLALKFIRQQGDDKIVTCLSTTVIFEINEVS